MSKNDSNLQNLEKYDVEANIEEVDNTEERSVFKYGIIALSNPRNVRLAIEGIVRITGDTIERDEILNKDQNDVPKILTLIYQELFPTFFLLSKTLNVACPPHTIHEMGDGMSTEEESTQIDDSANMESEIPSEKNESQEMNSEQEQDIAQPTV